MQQLSVRITGPSIKEFQKHLQKKSKPEPNPYTEVDYQEKRNYGTGQNAGPVEVILLTLNIALDLMKDLLKDVIKGQMSEKGKHSATYTIKNDQGDPPLVITLNNLTMDEIRQMIDEFRGNITEVESA